MQLIGSIIGQQVFNQNDIIMQMDEVKCIYQDCKEKQNKALFIQHILVTRVYLSYICWYGIHLPLNGEKGGQMGGGSMIIRE